LSVILRLLQFLFESMSQMHIWYLQIKTLGSEWQQWKTLSENKLNNKKIRLSQHLGRDTQHTSCVQDHLPWLFYMIHSLTAKVLKQGNLWSLAAYLAFTADYPDFQEGCFQLALPSIPWCLLFSQPLHWADWRRYPGITQPLELLASAL